MGYLLVSAVLVVSLGRLGDLVGRVRMYNLGFAVFTVSSDRAGADAGLRQRRGAVDHRLAARPGGRRLDALRQLDRDPHRRLPGAPPRHGARHQPDRRDRRQLPRSRARRRALRDLLAERLLGERADRHRRHAVVVPLAARAHGAALGEGRLARQRHVRRRACRSCSPASPTASSPTAATRPAGPTPGCSPAWSAASCCSCSSASIEAKVDEPMFRLGLFRNRAFALGNLAGLLSSMGRGGLQFMLIIWLQGIWLPLHGYSFESTPLWAGIYLLPLTVGFVASGPVSRLALRQVRHAALRRHRSADRRGHVRRAPAAARRLQLRALRDPHVPQRRRLGHVRVAEHRADHERRARPRTAARRPACAARSSTPGRRSRSASSSR